MNHQTTAGHATLEDGRVVIRFGYLAEFNELHRVNLDVTPYVVELIRDLAAAESSRQAEIEAAAEDAEKIHLIERFGPRCEACGDADGTVEFRPADPGETNPRIVTFGHGKLCDNCEATRSMMPS